MLDAVTQELLSLTQRLLDAIVSGDWETYQSLCDPSLSAHEPEARGLLVEGMALPSILFHAATAFGRSAGDDLRAPRPAAR